jgi:DNA-binding beta-propeller fold protein YncE
LPALSDCAVTLGEISAPGASVPLSLSREPDGSLSLEFENDPAATGGYNIYRGHIGSFYDHDTSSLNACSVPTSEPEPGRLRTVLPPDEEAATYFLVTGIYPAGEGTAGFDSRGDEIPVIKNVCAPDGLTRGLVMTWIGEYDSEAGVGGAEIVKARTYTDAGMNRLEAWIVNNEDKAVDVVTLDDPTLPVLRDRVVLSSFDTGGPTSLALDPQGRGVAVTLPHTDEQDPGWVQLMDFSGELGSFQVVGALPDMLTFTPDGSTILVANEGEPDEDYNPDPEGSVSLLKLTPGFTIESTTTVRLADVPTLGDVRHFGPNAAFPEKDYEPEHITVEPSGDVAWVVLQENNAIAKLDLTTEAFVEVRGLGAHDYMTPGGGLDPSDEDAGIAIDNWPVSGFYQPDGAIYLEVRGRSLLVTSNEGEARDYLVFSEVARVNQLDLEGPISTMQADGELGRLEVTTTRGDEDDNGEFESLFAFGARSIAIFDPRGGLEPLWDSGDALEQMTAAALPDDFNSDNDSNDSFDDRSRKRGPEPEGIVVGSVCGRKYVFVGLERVSGVAIFAVGDPENSIPAGYFTSRDFTVSVNNDDAGGIGAEGLAFVGADKSPNGVALLLVANEKSGTLDVWEVVPEYP